MQDMPKLVVDMFCEVHDLLRPWQHSDFWDLNQVEFEDSTVYLIGRQQFHHYIDRIRKEIHRGGSRIVFSNPHEGSATILGQIARLNLLDELAQNKFSVITGGDIGPYPSLVYDSFLPKIMDYAENAHACRQYQRHWTTDRPWKFLFLNGRGRPHRQRLFQLLEDLLPQALWSNLDSFNGAIQLLPENYEYIKYRGNTTLDQGFVKHQLFAGEWGEAYLESAMYQDSYFSLVTETVFDVPLSFRTEKIWKPIAIGHPFVAVANAGYYRDLRRLGFQTFAPLIDESFDQIEDNDQRLNRIAQVVRELCQQDLAKFAQECYTVCKYNQQRLAELRIQVREEFPARFQKFINE